MKKKTAFCLILITVVMLFSSCSPGPIAPDAQTPDAAVAPSETATPTSSATSAPKPTEGGVITVYNSTEEVTNIIKKYIELHPDFPYTINAPIGGLYEGSYTQALDDALTGKSSDAADIYCVEQTNVLRYTQGEMTGYAMPYKDLIPDADAKIAAAKIAPFIVQVGTRPSDNAVVGLAYQNTAGVFIYRRSIAKETWGTDDPAVIAAKIGPGWERFFSAAEELKQKGYRIVSGDGDIWHAIENSADNGWLQNGKLTIDPKREAFLDYAKELRSKKYSNGTVDWTEAWYADMNGTGKKPVFGFSGPAWLINYVMTSKCVERDENGNEKELDAYGDWAVCEPPVGFFWSGLWVLASNNLNSDPAKKAAVAELIDWINLQCGEDSLQSLLANGTLYGLGSVKDAVASETVMANADGTLEFLGGQNMFDTFILADRNINGNNLTDYDQTINMIWRDQVRKYVDGACTRDEAIAAFKQQVADQLHIDAAS